MYETIGLIPLEFFFLFVFQSAAFLDRLSTGVGKNKGRRIRKSMYTYISGRKELAHESVFTFPLFPMFPFGLGLFAAIVVAISEK